MRNVLVPRVQPEKLRSERFGDYALRFAFGATIAFVSAIVGMTFGPKLGGVLLGFPAVLPAALTLIQKKEGPEQAAIDSVGAILGAIAMIAFAIVVWRSVTSWGVVPSLLVGLLVWLVAALGLYFLVALLYKREPAPP